MAKRLDDTSRGILEFRPQINFVEPDVKQGPIQPITELPQLTEAVQKADEVRKLAKSVDVLAAALQAKADLRAKDMVIKLDPKVDALVIASMKRAHPAANPLEITYPQYAYCKENQRKKGLALAGQGLVSPEQIQKAQANLDSTQGFDAGFNSEAAKNGGFRPEVNPTNQILEPLDMEETQNLLLKILVNFLWQEFIKPAIPLPPGVPGLPDQLVDTPEGLTPRSFAKKVNKTIKKGKEQLENLPTAEALKISASAAAGNLKAAGSVSDLDVAAFADKAIRDPNTAAADLQALENKIAGAPSTVNPFAIHDCYTITRTFERAAAYCTTEESVFAMLRPSLTNIRIMAGSQETRSLASNAILDGALGMDADGDEETTGDDDSLAINSIVGDLTEDAGGTGATKKKAFVDTFNDWLKDCIPCDFSLPSAGDFFAKLGVDISYSRWFNEMLAQLAAIASLWNMDSSFSEICALINFFKNVVCIPDLRRIIVILMLLLMRISFSISGLFDFILSLVAPLIIPFLSGIADTVEKFMLAIVKPIECTIDSIIGMINKLDYSAIFQKANIKSMAVEAGPQGRGYHSDGVNLKLTTPRIQIETIDYDYNPPDKTIPVIGRQDHDASELGKAAQWGLGFNLFDYTLGQLKVPGVTGSVNQHMADEAQAVQEANRQLEEIRLRRGDVDFTDDKERETYLAELEEARKIRSDAVDDRDLTGGQQLRSFLETAKKDLRSVVFILANYLREAIQVVEAFVADITGEFRKLMEAFLGGSESSIVANFRKLELIKLVAMIVSFIGWLTSGANCDEEEPNTARFLPDNQEARSITVADDGTVTIIERPDLIEAAIDSVVSAVGPEPYSPDMPKPGAEVIGTPADRSRQKLNSLVEFTGNPVLDTEIARVVDAITTPAQEVFKCPLQTSVAQAEQVNTWMRELNTT